MIYCRQKSTFYKFPFAGLGLGLIFPSTFVAVKDYFSTNRGRAVGLSMAGTGLGQMLMPQLVGFLLNEFGFAWTTRIIGVLCLHGAVGSLLFQVPYNHLQLYFSNIKTKVYNVSAR